MIDRRKPRRRRPRLGQKRPGTFRGHSEQKNFVPRSRGGISKALEKYTNLAQDAFSNGDRIAAESYFQYAEHYQRLLNENNFTSDFSSDKKSSQQDNEVDQSKPTRTQRAMNAKNERLNKAADEEVGLNKNNHTNNVSIHSKNGSKENFTSDGLEALKPFEVSMDEKKSQS